MSSSNENNLFHPDGTPWTADDYAWSARRYVPYHYRFMPLPSGLWAVYTAANAEPHNVKRLTEAEITSWLREDFEKTLQAIEAARIKRNAEAEARAFRSRAAAVTPLKTSIEGFTL